MSNILEPFHQFAKLAPEIQLKVWRAAIPKGQVVVVLPPLQEVYEIEDGWTEVQDTTPARAHTDEHVRHLMGTCTVARKEVLAVYSEFKTPGFNLHRNFHFDAEHGVLLFSNPTLLDFFLEPRFMLTTITFAPVNLANLAVKFDFTNGFDSGKVISLVTAVRLLPSVKTISIVTTTRCQEDPIVVNFLATFDSRVGNSAISVDCVFEEDFAAN